MVKTVTAKCDLASLALNSDVRQIINLIKIRSFSREFKWVGGGDVASGKDDRCEGWGASGPADKAAGYKMLDAD